MQLKRCANIDKRWNRKAVSRSSPVCWAISKHREVAYVPGPGTYSLGQKVKVTFTITRYVTVIIITVITVVINS